MYPRLHVVDGFRSLNVQCDGIPGERLYEDLQHLNVCLHSLLGLGGQRRPVPRRSGAEASATGEEEERLDRKRLGWMTKNKGRAESW